MLRRARRVALAAVVDSGAAAAGTDESPDDSPICSILTVRIDNVIDPRYTKLTVDVSRCCAVLLHAGVITRAIAA